MDGGPGRRGRRAPLLALAVCVGVLGAAGNAAFRWAIHAAGRAFGAVAHVVGTGGVVVAMLLAGVVLLLLERGFPGEVLGYGFPRFLEMLHLHGARVKRRWIILKTLSSAISLGAGVSVGREGPIAQIGGSLGMLVAGLARLPVDARRVMVAAGAAAGVAATFEQGLRVLAAKAPDYERVILRYT